MGRPAEIVGDLYAAKEFEMVDQKRAGEHDQPADGYSRDRHGDLRIVDLPHHGRDRPLQNSGPSRG